MIVAKIKNSRNSCFQSTGDTGGNSSLRAPGGGHLDTTEYHRHSPLTPLQKRARRVAFSKPLARLLMGSSQSPKMVRAYARTVNTCGQVVEQVDGKLKTTWCGGRWCAACGAIRTARAYAAYGDEVRSWGDDLYLVTLTVPNCTGAKLRDTVKAIHHNFSLICLALRRKYGTGNVKMIRATECTYSEVRGDFHPHCHIACRGKDIATALLAHWMKRNPEASPRAQDIRKGDAGTVAEIFKYSTKLASDKRDADGSRKVVPAHALDTIFQAFYRQRLWQVVGITAANNDEGADDDNAEIDVEVGTAATTRKDEHIIWHWCQSLTDWVDFATGDTLSQYEAGRHARALIQKLEMMADEASQRVRAAP